METYVIIGKMDFITCVEAKSALYSTHTANAFYYYLEYIILPY